MKRWIGALLVLCMMVACCVGFAADAVENDVFTMPNGVQFGMTWEEVDALETGELIKETYSFYYYKLTSLGSVDLTQYFADAYVEYGFFDGNGLRSIHYCFDVTDPAPGHVTECLLQFAVVEKGLLESYRLKPVGVKEAWRSGATPKTSEEGRALAIFSGDLTLFTSNVIFQTGKYTVTAYHEFGYSLLNEFGHTILFYQMDQWW